MEEEYDYEGEPSIVKRFRRRNTVRTKQLMTAFGVGSYEELPASCKHVYEVEMEEMFRQCAREWKEEAGAKDASGDTLMLCSPGKTPISSELESEPYGECYQAFKRRRMAWLRNRVDWYDGIPTPPSSGIRLKPWTPKPLTPSEQSGSSLLSQRHVARFDEGLLDMLSEDKATGGELTCTKEKGIEVNEGPLDPEIITYTPQEGVPERMDPIAAETRGGVTSKDGSITFTPQEGVPERLIHGFNNAEKMEESQKEPILEMFASFERNLELDSSKRCAPNDNANDAEGPHASVDCLLTSDTSRNSPHQGNLGVSVVRSSGAGTRKASMPISEGENSVRCSRVGVYQPVSSQHEGTIVDGMQSPAVVHNRHGMRSITRRRKRQQSSPGKTSNVPSLDSWSIASEQRELDQSNKKSISMTDAPSYLTSDPSKWSGLIQDTWRPPRAPTPFNWDAPPPSDELTPPTSHETSINDEFTTPSQTIEVTVVPSSPSSVVPSSPSTVAPSSPPQAPTPPQMNTPTATLDDAHPSNGIPKDDAVESASITPASGNVTPSTVEDSHNKPISFGSPTGFVTTDIDSLPVNIDYFDMPQDTLANVLSPKDDNVNESEVQPEQSEQENMSKRTKKKKQQKKKKKKNRTKAPKEPHGHRRTSLCGQTNGSTWVEEDGQEVRRSQRERVRPLRWWEGEKAVYLREHSTLPTVVGYEIWTPEPRERMVSLEQLPSVLRSEGDNPKKSKK